MKSALYIVGEQLHGHTIVGTLWHKQVGITLLRLDIHLVHRLQYRLVSVDYHLRGSTALNAVA